MARGCGGRRGRRGEHVGDPRSIPDLLSTLLSGVAKGIAGLTSVAFGVAFTIFSVFPAQGRPGVPPLDRRAPRRPASRRRDDHRGRDHLAPQVLHRLTIVAVFNAVVVGVGALLLDVRSGTIAVVTFVTAYVPYVGAFVAGAFAVMLALADGGTTTALLMLLIVLLANGLLQNVVQPIAFGATLDLNPLLVLVATIAAGSLFGMIGLISAARSSRPRSIPPRRRTHPHRFAAALGEGGHPSALAQRRRDRRAAAGQAATTSVPPSASVRSRSPSSPVPFDVSAPPWPSSTISRRRLPSVRPTVPQMPSSRLRAQRRSSTPPRR